MLYTVMEVAKTIGLSKQSIYNKLKLKGLENHITRKKSVTYIDEVGLNLIRDSLKVTTEPLNNSESETVNSMSNKDVIVDTDVSSLDKELFDLLKDQLKENRLQLNEKDLQIKELHKLLENSQVLLNEKPKQNILELEEHFQDLDTKLEEVKEKMQERKNDHEPKGFLSKLFNKK